MQNKRIFKDILFGGILLFSIFVGAGNIILPPFVGVQSATQWGMASLGFIITAVGVTLMGCIAVIKTDGDANRLSDLAWPFIIKVLNMMVLLIIGPLFAIPRTAAFTYEFSVLPFIPETVRNVTLFGNINLWSFVSAVLYFAVVYFFIKSGTKSLDKISKILSPILVIFIFLAIIISVIKPAGSPEGNTNQGFYFGFLEGYQTMDGLGGALLGAVVAGFVSKKGYQGKQSTKIFISCALVAGTLMALFYIGFIWMGASATSFLTPALGRTLVLSQTLQYVGGQYGILLLQIIVLFACLSTATALLIAFSEFFADLSHQKIPSKVWMIAGILFSLFMCQIGVDGIINAAVPVLVAIYPIIIVIFVLNLLPKSCVSKYSFRGAVLAVIILAPFFFFSALYGQQHFTTKLLQSIPFISPDFIYIPLSILGFVIGVAYDKLKS